MAEGGYYILKPGPEEYPHASENEHTAMITSKRLVLALAKRLQIPAKPVKTFIRKIKQKKATLLLTINNSYMPDDMKAKAKQLIEKRLRVLLIGVDGKDEDA